MVELNLRATFKTFSFRPLVNGNKLQLVFEADWKHLPKEPVMEEIRSIVQKVGDLTFLESEVQVEPHPDDKDQHRLPLEGKKDGPKKTEEIK